jgi:hypothetical protein
MSADPSLDDQTAGVLVIGTLRVQYHHGRKPPTLRPGIQGWWKPHRRGVLIHDAQSEPILYVVNNRWRERLIVSCSRLPDARIWCMHSVCTNDERRFGLPKGHLDRGDLATALIDSAERIDRRITRPQPAEAS